MKEIISSFSRDIQAAILVCTHRSEGKPIYLAEVLNNTGRLPAKIVEDGEDLECGHIYISRPGYHFLIDGEGKARLTLSPKVEGFRPSINELFRSAAEQFTTRVIGVVLSGCLYDGATGLLDIKKHGGTTIVQNLEEAEFPWMPLAALEKDGHIDKVLKARDIETYLKENA